MDNNRIKALHAGGRSIASLAQQFGVSEKEIKDILYTTKVYVAKPQEVKEDKPKRKRKKSVKIEEPKIEENNGNDTEAITEE
jgi:transposase